MKLTVRQLKEIIKDLGDDVEVVATSSNYELRGNNVAARARIDRYRVDKESFRDDFDGTKYTSEVYKQDVNGQQVLVISG